MHSTGSMKSCTASSLPSSPFLGWMQSTGQASAQAVSLVPMQGSAITYAISKSSQNYIKEYPFGIFILSAENPRQTCRFVPQTRTVADGILIGLPVAGETQRASELAPVHGPQTSPRRRAVAHP